MRVLLTCLLLASACGGDDAVGADAGADARPGPVDGLWHLTWTCVDVCGGGAMPIFLRPLLRGEGTTLRYSNDPEGTVNALVETGRVDQGCVYVAATAGALKHEEYWMCPRVTGGLVSRIAWSTDDGRLGTWNVVGVP